MAFSPITSDQDISYARTHSHFRNAAREDYWGVPVFFTPSNWPYNTGKGYGGPRYGDSGGYNYDNSPYTSDVGNCTWWCAGRCEEANGIYLGGLGNGVNWYTNYTGNKSTTLSNLKAGDIISFSDNTIYGHVMFVEQISGSTVTISQSAASTHTSFWSGKSCTVETYSLSDLAVGSSVDMYKSRSGLSHSVTVVGYLHTGGGSSGQSKLTYGVTPSEAGYITGDSQGYYDTGTQVTITANANDGYTFKEWSNGYIYPTATITLDHDEEFIAYFEQSDESTEYIACQMAIKKKKGQINEITILV